MIREELRVRIGEALAQEYGRLVREKVVDSPQGHVNSLADAVTRRLETNLVCPCKILTEEEGTAMTQYEPRPGDIGLTQISGAGGKSIRLAQWLNGEGWDDYQHAFGVTEYRQGLPKTPWIVEAMPGGAQHVKNWHDPARTRWLICPDEHRAAVASALRGFTGVPYSDADYLALAAHRLHIPAPHLEKYIRDSGHMICSQLVDAAAAEGGWHLFKDGRWPGYVTPLSLNKLWLSLGPEARA